MKCKHFDVDICMRYSAAAKYLESQLNVLYLPRLSEAFASRSRRLTQIRIQITCIFSDLGYFPGEFAN